ncbi:hemerythrin domain-containing protein [Streptomyces sp. ECR3.8]|uniref:hemerythrin domain-containing protein n=1 Tax=Streptomyces sp. ECR3.8 TaxID=3461009 RepID=UPI004042DCC2
MAAPTARTPGARPGTGRDRARRVDLRTGRRRARRGRQHPDAPAPRPRTARRDDDRCLSEDLPNGELDALWLDIVQLVFSHAFAEETVLWPLLRRVSPDGEELTRQVEAEHQAVNDLVARIEHSPDDPRRAEWIRQAFALIRQDIRDEEDELLPRLRTAFDDRKLRRIGAAWEAVRATAPTRPHPGVPRRPPGNALRGVPLSAFDRLRDLAPGSGPAARRASLAAAGVAAGGAVVLAVRSARRLG